MDVRVVLCLLLNVVFGMSQTDKRCFLEGGWSTISFFVREDLDVNSVIGKIRAIGECVFKKMKHSCVSFRSRWSRYFS